MGKWHKNDEELRIDRLRILEERTDKSGGADACWPWTGSQMKTRKAKRLSGVIVGGYGQFAQRIHGKNRGFLAHRYVYEISHGVTLGPNDYVMHTCDNPPCVNPRHLRRGDPTANVHDMINKGRQRFGNLGSLHGNSKLTEDQVLAIRAEYAAGGVSQASLARKYAVTQTVIGDIVRRKSWIHI